MKNLIRKRFEGGRIWDYDIESANEIVARYIRSLGGNDAMIEDILDLMHQDTPLTKWDGERILQAIDDYIDR